MRTKINRGRNNSQVRPPRDRSCTGKRKFGQSRARGVARQMRSRDAHEIFAYHCSYCRHWHVGHSRPRRDHRRQF